MIDNSKRDSNDREDKNGGDSNSFHQGYFVFMGINERCIGVRSYLKIAQSSIDQDKEVIKILLNHHLMNFTRMKGSIVEGV
ncbi:MAG: hypothetical protein HOK56_04745 [Deltaproteobacteria bacterium]|nr:hypothetical protein [Deltaproteobacteria bacterium]